MCKSCLVQTLRGNYLMGNSANVSTPGPAVLKAQKKSNRILTISQYFLKLWGGKTIPRKTLQTPTRGVSLQAPPLPVALGTSPWLIPRYFHRIVKYREDFPTANKNLKLFNCLHSCEAYQTRPGPWDCSVQKSDLDSTFIFVAVRATWRGADRSCGQS